MHLVIIFLLLSFLLPETFSLNKEGLFLHQAKLALVDRGGFLSSWSSGNESPCLWRGVTCSSPDNGAVTSVDLSSFNLAGSFPAVICRLPRLSSLTLFNNSFSGPLPAAVSDCSSLSHLDLSQNFLTGELPATLSDLPDLRYLDLSGNNFSGVVPLSFGSFQNLQVISIVDNLFDGPFPGFLSNVTTLRELNLSYNPFQPSRLAPELGNLTSLEKLWLTNCQLVGEIPDSLGRLGKLTNLDLAVNRLTGSVPSSFAGLSNIVQIELYDNFLTGELPAKVWSNLTLLRNFDASMNRLSGTIPDELAGLHLASLNLYENELEGKLPATIAGSPNLYELKVFGNRLSGELPGSLGENSPLSLLDVSNNRFSGDIPANLCAMGQLQMLLMIQNSFSGEIPATLSECRSLKRVRLGNNHLSGDVPAGFWGLPHASLLELVDNSFSGSISKAIASASNLSVLDISNNRFSSQIPVEIGSLSKLVSFLGSDNRFSGPLPDSIVNLDQLGQLDLHNNELSGDLPSGVQSWKKLNELNLANNGFSGRIPTGIGSLFVLNYLDLSGNRFSGQVPIQLQNLKLNLLNISNNQLSRPLPPLFAKESYKNSFLGNPGLCGDIIGLCENGVKSRGNLFIIVLAGLALIVGLGWFYWKYMYFKQGKGGIGKLKWTIMSFHKLSFNEHEISNCLIEDNMIGSGASGKVYKAVLSSGETVTVKKLWGNLNRGDVEKGGFVQDDTFKAEVETLGRIKHKNIVRLWCCCSSRDCKLLVYQYMPNGSLGDLLHSSKGGLLDWAARYKIALDAAEGLAYLHHDCVPPIVHRHVKSNNILLDQDFGARVADFGVAKVVDSSGRGTKSMSVIAHSRGYIAPEYAYTLRENEKSDIYSFGVVILELITGKRPIDPEYGQKDLVRWVRATLDQKGIDHILYPKLHLCFKEEIGKVLNIGLLCTSPLPINRPSMRRVVKMLQEVRGENQSKSGKNDGNLTPYYYEDASNIS